MFENFQFSEIIFLPAIIFIGSITSFEDLNTGKIRNKWIKFGIFYWLFFFSLIFIIENHFDQEYYFHFFSNIIFTGILGFVLWEFNIIGAGDAKLFWVFSLLIPLKFYWKTFLPLFPSAVIFINTFILIIIYLLVVSLYSFFLKKPKKKSFINLVRNIKKKNILDYKFVLGPIFGFLTIITIFNLLIEYFEVNIQNLSVYLILTLYFFRKFLNHYFSKKNIITYLPLYLLILFIYGISMNPEFTIKMIANLINYLIFFAALLIVNFFVKRYIQKTCVKKIKYTDLKTQMHVDKIFIENLKKDKKFFKEKIGRIYPGGLTKKQAKEIKNWCKNKSCLNIEIYKPFKMAIWIFGGVITTLIFQGSIIKLIIH